MRLSSSSVTSVSVSTAAQLFPFQFQFHIAKRLHTPEAETSILLSNSPSTDPFSLPPQQPGDTHPPHYPLQSALRSCRYILKSAYLQILISSAGNRQKHLPYHHRHLLVTAHLIIVDQSHHNF
jgi:hypothetical protein